MAPLMLPISPSLLSAWFQAMGLACSPEAVFAACDRLKPDVAPLRQLGQVLKHLGIRGMQAAQLGWSRFDRRHLPALVLLDHAWWLAQPATGDAVLLNDGQGRSREVQPAQLSRSRVLWLRPPVPGEHPHASAMWRSPAARLIGSALLQRRRWMVDVALATLVVNVLAVATSLFAMQVYDRVVPTFAYATLTAMVSGMLVVAVTDLVLRLLRAFVLEQVARRADRAVSQQLFEHLLRLRLDVRSGSVGALSSAFGALESVRNFFSSTLIFALVDLPFALLFLGVIGLIGGLIGWLYAALLCVALLLGGLTRWRLRSLARSQLQHGGERQGLLVECIQGVETIQAQAAGWRFVAQWARLADLLSGYSTRSKLTTSFSVAVASTLGSLAYIAAVAIGVTRIEEGVLTVGGLIACTILGGRVIGPATQVVQVLGQWQHVRESLTQIDQLLTTEAAQPANTGQLAPASLERLMEAVDLRFSYPGLPVLQVQVDRLTLRAGDRVALVGGIGSGKSTLLRLLAGIYRPTEGVVRLGSADLRLLDAQSLADNVGYLPQEVQLFRGSLRSNLQLVDEDDDTLLQVSRLLGIEALASDHPRGYERPVAEGGKGLSGGQRQLVALARVFLARPKVWLLDEPTASLDSESARRVAQALQAWLRPDDILVMATHQGALAPLVNRVLVLKNGRVVADQAPQRSAGIDPVQKEPAHA